MGDKLLFRFGMTSPKDKYRHTHSKSMVVQTSQVPVVTKKVPDAHSLTGQGHGMEEEAENDVQEEEGDLTQAWLLNQQRLSLHHLHHHNEHYPQEGGGAEDMVSSLDCYSTPLADGGQPPLTPFAPTITAATVGTTTTTTPSSNQEKMVNSSSTPRPSSTTVAAVTKPLTGGLAGNPTTSQDAIVHQQLSPVPAYPFVADQQHYRRPSSQSLTSSEAGTGRIMAFHHSQPPSHPSLRSKSTKKVPSYRNNVEFHAVFPHLPMSEFLLHVFSCALLKDLVLIQGKIWVTPHHIGFKGWDSDQGVLIPIASILTIVKKNVAFIIPNSLEICTTEQKYFFASFFNRDLVFRILVELWQSTQQFSIPEPMHLASDPQVSGNWSTENIHVSSGAVTLDRPASATLNGNLNNAPVCPTTPQLQSVQAAPQRSSPLTVPDLHELARHTNVEVPQISSMSTLVRSNTVPSRGKHSTHGSSGISSLRSRRTPPSPIPTLQDDLISSSAENLNTPSTSLNASSSSLGKLVEELCDCPTASSSKIADFTTSLSVDYLWENWFNSNHRLYYNFTTSSEKFRDMHASSWDFHGGRGRSLPSDPPDPDLPYRTVNLSESSAEFTQTLSAIQPGVSRHLEYIVPVTAALGPKQTRVHTFEKVVALSPNRTYCCIHTMIKVLDIPAANCFHSQVRLCLRAVPSGGTRILVHAAVVWTKSSMLRSIITKTTMDNTREFYVKMESFLKGQVEESALLSGVAVGDTVRVPDSSGRPLSLAVTGEALFSPTAPYAPHSSHRSRKGSNAPSQGPLFSWSQFAGWSMGICLVLIILLLLVEALLLVRMSRLQLQVIQETLALSRRLVPSVSETATVVEYLSPEL